MSIEQPAVEGPIEHPAEDTSNDVRRQLADLEPKSQRTFTPSLAVIERSAGCYHFTPEGRKLADFTSGVLVANLGHNPSRWWRSVLGYMGLDDFDTSDEYVAAVPLTAYNAVTELEVQAADRLVASIQVYDGGIQLDHVLWAASGSEAIQKALWTCMSRRPGSEMILATRYGFHGKKGLAGAVTGSENDPHRDPRVKFISFPFDECRNVERRRQPLDLGPYERELESLWKQHGDQICCLITEPYLGGGGSIHPQKEYLQLLARFCREHDIVFILDEIQSNFGRTGSMYAFDTYGVEPDMVVLGKGLGNGVPVDAVVGRRDLFAGLPYGIGSDTWSAHPLGCAAVLATLDEFEYTGALENAEGLAEIFEAGLLRLQETGLVAHVRGEGTVWGIECQGVGSSSAEQVAAACVEACYLGDGQGRAIHLLGPLAGKVLRVAPPLVMNHDEAREYLGVMYDIFTELRKRLES
jgi:4-aminobutyrate aminotransferase-like enzyme